MPGSDGSTRPFSIDKIKSYEIKSILDVGPGLGTYAMALADAGWVGTITGIEIWEPYVNSYNLNSKYNEIIVKDIRNHDNFNYDLIIFGDVLEHMTKDEAILVWERASKQAKYGLIAIPIIHYPQGESEGNPYEAHIKDDWTHEEVIDTFKNIIDSCVSIQTAAYWAEFK